MEKFTQGNYIERSQYALSGRVTWTSIVAGVTTTAGIEAEQRWDFFENLDFSDEGQIAIGLLAMVLGVVSGGVWGITRLVSIDKNRDSYPEK